MKFTKEQVLENIKAKLANSQKLSDRTIIESVESLLGFVNDETELTDFVDKVYPAIASTNTNLIKEQADFVKDYKSALPTVPPVVVPPTPFVAGALDLEALARVISEQNKAQLEPFTKTISDLEDKLNSFETQKNASEISAVGWAKHRGSNPYEELEDFANIAKKQTDAIASSFTTADEWYTVFSTAYNEFSTALGKGNGYKPIDSTTGAVIEPESDFVKNVKAIEAKEKDGSTEAVASRLGI